MIQSERNAAILDLIRRKTSELTRTPATARRALRAEGLLVQDDAAAKRRPRRRAEKQAG